MSAAAIAIIVLVVAVVLVVIAIRMVARRRQLRQRFGPEYDRVVAEKHSQLKAEAELAGRERRIQRLDIKPLSPESQARYAAEWTAIQERFVDQPQRAVEQAQQLVVSVMNERGYPTGDSGQIMADLSVEHANTLDNYREAQQISANASAASTEDLRQAMVHYRALFSDLLGQRAEAPSAAEGNPPAARVPADETGGDTNLWSREEGS
jgi:hypothetical protein